MSSSGVPVQLQPRTAECRATTAWHADSALLVCSFQYGGAPKRPAATIAERIDAALGISTTPPRALLGDIEVTWRDVSRLGSIELRTGRGQWQPSDLPAPGPGVDKSSMTFRLEYDANGIASVDLDVRVLWDARRASIALSFGQVDEGNARWVVIAEDAFVRVDDEDLLMEIRLANVQIVSANPS